MRDLHFQCDPHTHTQIASVNVFTDHGNSAANIASAQLDRSSRQCTRACCFSRYDDDFNCVVAPLGCSDMALEIVCMHVRVCCEMLGEIVRTSTIAVSAFHIKTQRCCRSRRSNGSIDFGIGAVPFSLCGCCFYNVPGQTQSSICSSKCKIGVH